ncbi:MAG: hypothetical protein V4722_12500 [Bacteroidota bacterium]
MTHLANKRNGNKLKRVEHNSPGTALGYYAPLFGTMPAFFDG